MAHHTVKQGYLDLIERINRFPQGAPPSDLLHRILEMLFSEREADLVSLLPIKAFTAEKAAQVWKMPVDSARVVLDELAGRAILVDIESEDGVTYALPPPMAGFFEFSMMRIRDDLDQKVLAELFYQYLNVEEDFIKASVRRGPDAARQGVRRKKRSLPTRQARIQVLDHERASEVVRGCFAHRGVGICYCRHKMDHNWIAAAHAPKPDLHDFQQFTAASLIKTRLRPRRSTSAGGARPPCRSAQEGNLIQFGENIQQRGPNFICNCCGCCCEAMIAARRFGHLHPVHTTNFMPSTEAELCTGCGKCVAACPVEAMTLVSANDSAKPKRKAARLDEDLCLGCGVCVPVCPEDGITLTPREERVITPVDSVRRTVAMAVERGTLQHLIFDNHALASHRAMAAVLGAILQLPPVKRSMAQGQLGSRYLDKLIEWNKRKSISA